MKLWWIKLRLSLRSIGSVLTRPAYVALALLAATVSLGILLWIFNINLLIYILGNPTLSILDKILFVLNGYVSVFTNFDSINAATLLVFSILLGVNAGMVTYVIRDAGRTAAREGGKSGLSLVAAVIGAGCAACGTGILGPVLSAVGASGSIALTQAVGAAANILGIGLVLYSLYGLGKSAAAIQARARYNRTS